MNSCPLCEELSILPLPPLDDKTYYHCRSCDLILLSPSCYLSRDQERERYLLHNNTRENTGYVKMFQDFLKNTIFPFVQERGRALDFGCGPGPVLGALLEEAGFLVELYDPFFFPQQLTGPPYLLVTATEVLEHIGDSKGVFLQFKDLLQTGGYLALRTCLHPGPERFSDWWYRKDPTHVVFYSWRTFCYLQEESSWRIIYGDEEKQLLLQQDLS